MPVINTTHIRFIDSFLLFLRQRIGPGPKLFVDESLFQYNAPSLSLEAMTEMAKYWQEERQCHWDLSDREQNNSLCSNVYALDLVGAVQPLDRKLKLAVNMKMDVFRSNYIMEHQGKRSGTTAAVFGASKLKAQDREALMHTMAQQFTLLKTSENMLRGNLPNLLLIG